MFGTSLEGMRVAVLAADGFEQVELTRPVKKLRKHGAEVEIVSLRSGSIQGMNLLYPGKKIEVDRTIRSAGPEDYDALHIPGGFINPDLLRQSRRVLEFVRRFDAAGKPIATLCHGPWVLISAGLVPGRRLAAWPGIRDDIVNAGGEWVDEAVVHDGNWVSSRSPLDLHAFDRAIVKHFAKLAVAPVAEDDGYPAFAERGSGPSLAPLMLGGLAAAGLTYVASQTLRSSREGPALMG